MKLKGKIIDLSQGIYTPRAPRIGRIQIYLPLDISLSRAVIEW